MRNSIQRFYATHLLKVFSSFSNEVCRRQMSIPFSSCSPCSNFSVGNDPTALASALVFCENSRSFVLGKQIHSHVMKSGFTSDTFSQNNLIKMYMKFEVLNDGFKVFEEMPRKNIVSWTLVISSTIKSEEFELGLEVYVDMTRNGLVPNEFAIGSIMKACTMMGHDDFGCGIHCFALKVGIDINPFVASSVLNFYAKLGDIEGGEKVFEGMDYIDTGCWNAMAGGYIQCGCEFEALNIVYSMARNGISMDKYTFVNALQGCTATGDLGIGKQIHGFILRSNITFDTLVMNALINMYFKNGGRDSGFNVFEQIRSKDVVSWNTVFGGASQYEDPGEAARLYCKFLRTSIRPNQVTFSVLLRHCADQLSLNTGLQFFCHALCFGLHTESSVSSSLINMFSCCGKMEMALLVFENSPIRNMTIWNELISGHNFNSNETEALHIYCKLHELGVEANELTFCNILESCSRSKDQKMYSQIHGVIFKLGFASHGYICNSLVECNVKFGLLNDSSELLLHDIEASDIACRRALVSALVNQGSTYEAITVFRFIIQSSEKPDEFTMGSIFSSCADAASYGQIKTFHPFVIKMGYEANVFVASSIIDAYAKCGDIGSARMVFAHSYTDLIIFNTMIMAYAHNGRVIEAMDIYKKMKLADLQPNHSTFVSLLSACGHAGLVHQGCHLFESMNSKYGLVPSLENYGCLIDMLSRNGFLEEAKRIIEAMPFSTWPAIWRSFLSGCRIHGNRKLGQWGAKRLHELAPSNNAPYALLTKLYSEEDSWEDVAQVMKEMIESGVEKEVGYSWIET